MQLKDKIVLAFNKFYTSLLKDLKTTNDDIRKIIKKNYKVLDKLSDEHLVFFREQFGSEDDHAAILVGDSLNDKMIAKEVTLKMVSDSIDNEVDKGVFRNYLYILSVISMIYDEHLDDPDQDSKVVDNLFEKVITIISKIQKNEDIESLLDDIVDDDIKEFLTKVKDFNKNVKFDQEEMPKDTEAAGPSGSGGDLPKFPFPEMQDSMICNLAKEISNEIDVSNINIEKPEDVFKLMDFTSSNNLVGDIIKKVSSKIHDKISTGELKQEDLFGEAMNMMSMMNKGGGGGGLGGMAGMAEMMSGLSGMMGGGKGGAAGGLGDLGAMFNNPMMAEVMKSMKKGKVAPKADAFKKQNAKERLRAKLNARKNKDGDEAGPSS